MRSTSTFITTANLPAVLLSHPKGAPHAGAPQFPQFALIQILLDVVGRGAQPLRRDAAGRDDRLRAGAACLRSDDR